LLCLSSDKYDLFLVWSMRRTPLETTLWLTAIEHFFFFYCSVHHRDLHSFPTRRSSDLTASTLRWPSPNRDFRTSSSSMWRPAWTDRKSTRLNSSHVAISYAVFCLKKKISRSEGLDLARRPPARARRADSQRPQTPVSSL